MVYKETDSIAGAVIEYIPGHVEEGCKSRSEENDGDEEGEESALHSAAADRDENNVGCAGEEATEGLFPSQNVFLDSVKLNLI